MRNFKYVPNYCKGEKSIGDGYIILKIPSYVERMSLVKEFGIKPNSDGTVGYAVDALDSIKLMAKKLSEFIDEVCIIINPCPEYPDGLELKSFEDIEYNPHFNSVIEEMCGFILGGSRLEKKL